MTHTTDLAVHLDSTSYEAGSALRARFQLAAADCELSAVIRRLGESRFGVHIPLGAGLASDAAGYVELWPIPADAATGRYELTLVARDPRTGERLWQSRPVSFVVWRNALRIESFDTERRFYTPGDLVRFRLRVTNLTDVTQRGLVVTIGEAQYPWIAAQPGGPLPELFSLIPPITLKLRESRDLVVEGTVRESAGTGAVHYTALIRQEGSRQVLGFRQTPAVHLRAAAHDRSVAYPAAYFHAGLGDVRTDQYRSFYPAAATALVQFDTRQTSFRTRSAGTVRFRSVDAGQPLPRPIVELQDASGVTQAEVRAQQGVDGWWLATLPLGDAGLYRAVVHLPGGEQLLGQLELSANELPRAMVVICPHPDDEFLHAGAIRTAVENGVPVHIIYLTSGDAGGSERFFGPGYSPAEAIEFGQIRMAEARAAAQHLGVPEEHLHFLGLPDGFLEAIEQSRAGTIASPLLGVSCAPYEGVEVPNLAYQRQSVVQALTPLLAAVRPDVVYVSHPDERHADHRAAGRLTIEILQRLRLTASVRTDQFYGSVAKEPSFAGQSHVLFASGEAMARTQEAYWFYQTQGGNQARGQMLPFDQLPRTETHVELVDWAEPQRRHASPQAADNARYAVAI